MNIGTVGTHHRHTAGTSNLLYTPHREATSTLKHAEVLPKRTNATLQTRYWVHKQPLDITQTSWKYPRNMSWVSYRNAAGALKKLGSYRGPPNHTRHGASAHNSAAGTYPTHCG